MEHTNHTHHTPDWKLALSATVHCLLGCGAGDLLGVVLGTAWGWNTLQTNILAGVLGVLGGFILGVIPWLRANYTLAGAARQVLVIEGLSIAVMETTDVIVQSRLPMVVHGHLNEPLFWVGMGLALLAGFIAALPANYWLVCRGMRHVH